MMKRLRKFGSLGPTVVLLLVAVASFGSPPASASTTAFTCAKTGPGAKITDAHCVTIGSGEYSHVEITENTKLSASNAQTASGTTAAAPSVLKGTLSGVSTAVSCATVSGSGTLENSESGGEMILSGSGSLTYGGCTVTEPAGKGCVVKGGGFSTNPLSATTQGQGKAIKVEPTSGTKFTGVPIEGCSIAALNNTFPVSGSLKLTPSGATATTTHAGITEENTVVFGGQKAGLNSSLTLRGDSEGGEGWTPLTVT